MCRICGGLIVFGILFAHTSCVVYLQIYETVELVTGVQYSTLRWLTIHKGFFD